LYDNTFPHKRFKITTDFLHKHLSKEERILDLGVPNPFTKIMKDAGYEVENTAGEDLDDDYSSVQDFTGQAVTAFEIFEHLVAPYNVLKEIKCNKLFVSIPLKLWFAPAYRNKNDIRDQHYHEFEPWQLDYVLEKAGWEIKDSETFTNPVKKLGLRPLLRLITPRYYLVYCERSNS
jgi:hypothetical protein